ncbi:hypothetical protein C7B69_13065 [filamentous cyanobacterium Phorm 46]|nr:hypothetical protein C7B69_13065 [filamentous cyanobacterium Phorm 46]PSB52752.1 hypothetical protein C7B67_05780 [filamentous cyanobacterium Phorm 6]
MPPKNKAPIVILSLLITIALVGAAIWLLAGRSGANLPVSSPQTPNLPYDTETAVVRDASV